MRTRLQQLLAAPALFSQKLTPFNESGITHGFECQAVVDVAVEIEVIVKRGVGRAEFL